MFFFKFCKTCGNILTEEEKDNDSTLSWCANCKESVESTNNDYNFKDLLTVKKLKSSQNLDQKKPLTQENCSKCGHNQAEYFEDTGARALDQPPVITFTCTNCQHTWKDRQ